MAKETISSVTVGERVREQLNAMFTELYAKPGAATTSTAAELNVLDGVTATTAELNTLDGAAKTLTTTATPASGTCGVQFVFTDPANLAITGIRSGIGYISDATGALATAITSVATLTNGSVSTLVTGSIFHFVTTADGEVGITLTGTAGDKYVTFVLPNGKVVTSTACTINA